MLCYSKTNGRVNIMKPLDITREPDTADVLDITTEIIGNKAIIQIALKEEYSNDDTFFWNVKIYSLGKIILELDYGKHKEVILEPQNNGVYVFFVTAKNSKKSYLYVRRSFHYFDDEIKKSFESFYDSYNPQSEKQIDLWPLKEPYQNLALICFNDSMESKVLPDKSIIDGYKCTKLARTNKWNNIVLSSEEPLKYKDELIFFSGKTKYNSKLILGQKDIPINCECDKLLDEIGYFSAIHQNRNRILMTNDYYGMYSLYEYLDNDLTVVTNSYHMMLLILKAIGITMQLDIQTIIPYFVTGERMMFEQLASHDTFIHNVKKLPVHEHFCVDLTSCGNIEKTIAEILNKDVEYDEQEYKHLMDEAAAEIIQNIQIVLDDNRFDYVLCDVTGGKDSRTVLAALMNTSSVYNNKVYINSNDTPDGTERLSFIPLNHMHNYKYNCKPGKIKATDLATKYRNYRSASMGVSFSRKRQWEYELCEDSEYVMQIVGAGEQILRTTFSTYFNNVDYSSPSSLALSAIYAYNNGILSFDNMKEFIFNLLEKGFDEIVGTDYYEIFNHHCLYFRNAYHFGLELSIDCMENGKEQWMPLYNKASIKAWHMVCSKFKGPRYQYELIDHLCPVLMKVPFASNSDNQKLSIIKKEENFFDNRMDNVNIELNYDEDDWRNAKEQLLKSERPSVNIEPIYKELFETMMQSFNKILHYADEFKTYIGIEIYNLLIDSKDQFERGKANANVMFIYNKLMSLSDIIDIID